MPSESRREATAARRPITARRRTTNRSRIARALAAVIVLVALTAVVAGPARAQEPAGRLLIQVGGPAGWSPGVLSPTLELRGMEASIARPIGLVEKTAGSFTIDALPPGVYTVRILGAGAQPRPLRVGIHPGTTTVLLADPAAGSLRLAPFHPDPFGLDDSWDPEWTESLPFDGELALARATTDPAAPRHASLDGVLLGDLGFRSPHRIEDPAIASALRIPHGPAPASLEGTTRSILSGASPFHARAEGGTGTGGQSFLAAAGSYRFEQVGWKPSAAAALRVRNELDAAPSPFENDRLPHNGLDGIELLVESSAFPNPSTRLQAFGYASGTSRDYFLEPYRLDASHSPTEDRAVARGALRLEQGIGSPTRLLASIGVSRSFAETGDGVYEDHLESYARPDEANLQVQEDGLYWEGDDPSTVANEGHTYNYFRRMVQLDLEGRLEAWRHPGSERALGAGLFARAGTYRSYEHVDPISILVDDGGQAIGYGPFGGTHSDADGHEPGRPIVAGVFATARRPFLGGEIEGGLRGTFYRASQEPLRDLSDPLGGDEALDDSDLGDRRSAVRVDPRLAFSRPLGSRLHVWLSGGMETRVPPSEAVYYSRSYVERNAYAPSDEGWRNPIGNPDLEPERALLGAVGVGATAEQSLWMRASVLGERVDDAITTRLFPIATTEDLDSLVFYDNGGARERIGLALRAGWEPSERLRVRASYDLARRRTESFEPLLTDDTAWYGEDLPMIGPDNREGIRPDWPVVQDATEDGFFPSRFDRRHRVSLAVAARLPESWIAELRNVELYALGRASSGARFSWVQLVPAGLVPLPEAQPYIGQEWNSGTIPWAGQIDLGAVWSIRLFGATAQAWVEVINVTDRRNVTRVYGASGEADDDAWLESAAGKEWVASAGQGAAQAYRDRLQDPTNYGDPRLVRIGLRLRSF